MHHASEHLARELGAEVDDVARRVARIGLGGVDAVAMTATSWVYGSVPGPTAMGGEKITWPRMRLSSADQCVESSWWKVVRAFAFASAFFNECWACSRSRSAPRSSPPATISTRFCSIRIIMS